jgi:hypothetical protein
MDTTLPLMMSQQSFRSACGRTSSNEYTFPAAMAIDRTFLAPKSFRPTPEEAVSSVLNTTAQCQEEDYLWLVNWDKTEQGHGVLAVYIFCLNYPTCLVPSAAACIDYRDTVRS